MPTILDQVRYEYRHFDRTHSVISTAGRNLTEPMEPEFQAFREGEISPYGRNDGMSRNDGTRT